MVKQESLTFKLVIQNEFFLFFDFQLVTWSVNFYFSTSSYYLQSKKNKILYFVSNSKFNLVFYKLESVTEKKNLYKHFRVSN